MITLTPMRLVDLERIQAIETAACPIGWPPQAYEREVVENAHAVYLVARNGEEILGFGGVWVIFEEAHVTTLAVDPVHQGRGIGSLLLAGLLSATLERGGAWIGLEVRVSNLAAQRLYRRFGFTVIATRRGYYADNGEDALVMWAGDLRSPLFFERLLPSSRRVLDAP